MEYGKVVHFDAERGFGFIAPDRGGGDIFLHVSALDRSSDARQLKPDTQVSYDEAAGPRGTKAVRVKVIAVSEEDRWPEFTSGAIPVRHVTEWPIAEDELLAVFTEAWDLLLSRARERGWVA
jgi:cold shock CspA family protein